jgi:hypothetical protein
MTVETDISRLRHAALSTAQRLRGTRRAIGVDTIRGSELLFAAEALEDAALGGCDDARRPPSRAERLDRAVGALDTARSEMAALGFEMQVAIVGDMVDALLAAGR